MKLLPILLILLFEGYYGVTRQGLPCLIYNSRDPDKPNVCYKYVKINRKNKDNCYRCSHCAYKKQQNQSNFPIIQPQQQPNPQANQQAFIHPFFGQQQMVHQSIRPELHQNYQYQFYQQYAPPKAVIQLNVFEVKDRNIEAVFDFSIDSARYNFGIKYTFKTSEKVGPPLCLTDDLFDPSKGYIVDGFLTINLNGIFLIEKNNLDTELNCKNNGLPSGIIEKQKDFAIIIGDKDIAIHKELLHRRLLECSNLE